MKRINAGLAAILAFTCLSALLPAQDASGSALLDARPTDLILRDTVQVILNLDSARMLSSAPSPIINMLGGGTVIPLPQKFSLAPSIDVYSAYYNWVSGRAVPAMDENRTAVVLGAILDVPVNYTIDFTPIHRLILSGGPAFVIRAGVLANGVPSTEQSSVNSISGYLWDKGRFFYPEIGISYSYAAASWVRFGATARVMFPVFNWWSGENLSGADNMIVGGGIWLSFTDFWRNLKPLDWFKKKEKVKPLSPQGGDAAATAP
jgi:hypothetical protein